MNSEQTQQMKPVPLPCHSCPESTGPVSDTSESHVDTRLHRVTIYGLVTGSLGLPSCEGSWIRGLPGVVYLQGSGH